MHNMMIDSDLHKKYGRKYDANDPVSTFFHGFMNAMVQLKARGNPAQSNPTTEPLKWKPWGCKNLCPNGETKYFPALCKSFICQNQTQSRLRDSEATKFPLNQNKISTHDFRNSDRSREPAFSTGRSSHPIVFPGALDKFRSYNRHIAPVPAVPKSKSEDYDSFALPTTSHAKPYIEDGKFKGNVNSFHAGRPSSDERGKHVCTSQ
jgi:hypothetical protein